MNISEVKNIPFSNGATIGEVANLIDDDKLILLNRPYSSKDFVIETRQEEDSQSFVIRRR